MTSSRNDGRLLLALSVPLLPFAAAVARSHEPHTRTSALSQAMLLSLSIALTGFLLGFVANALDDGRDDTWPAISCYCLSVSAVAAFGFNGALLYSMYTSTTISAFTLMNAGLFSVGTLLAAAGLGALFANGMELPVGRHVLLFLGQIALTVYLLLSQNRLWAEGVFFAAAIAMLLGLLRVRSRAKTAG